MQFGRHGKEGEEKEGETQKGCVSLLRERHCEKPDSPPLLPPPHDSHAPLMLLAFAIVDGKAAAEVTGSD